MEGLVKLLPMMLRLAGEHEEVRQQAAFSAWSIVVGDRLRATCRPFRLYRKTLVVAVLNESWKKQMEGMSGQIIFRLNSLLGHPLVTLIEYRIDAAHVTEGAPQKRIRERDGSRKFRVELAADAECISDEELRESFLRAASRYLERREEEGKHADHPG